MGTNSTKCQYCYSPIPRNRLKCPNCGQWNVGSGGLAPGDDGTILLRDVTEMQLKRYSCGPWDRNFGEGGIVTTSVNLLGGVPGAGKSTLILQLVSAIAQSTGMEALLIGAEESEKQVKDRALRLQLKAMDKIRIVPLQKQKDASLENILVKRKLCCVVIDSINSYSEDPEHQVQIVSTLKVWADKLSCPFFVIGQVTKDEGLAGLMKLQHAVDFTGMLYNENGLRVLHTEKNRFGQDQIDTFYKMTALGLIETEDPDADVEAMDADEMRAELNRIDSTLSENEADAEDDDDEGDDDDE